MRTLISGFLQQKSDRQPFFDYVASEAENMTQEEFEDIKGRIFRDIEAVKNTHRHQALAKRSATITRGSQMVGILQTTTQQASSSTQAAAGSSSSSYVYYTTSPIGFGNAPSVVTVQDKGSRHNLSGIISQLPASAASAATAAALHHHHHSTASTAAAPSVASQSEWVSDPPIGSF